jgi:hypothetical protein
LSEQNLQMLGVKLSSMGIGSLKKQIEHERHREANNIFVL